MLWSVITIRVASAKEDAVKQINFGALLFQTQRHYPIMIYNRQRYGSFMFFGHVHNSNDWKVVQKMSEVLVQSGLPCNIYNVGCMLHGFEPVTFEEITGIPE